jgi:hypothetical protein
MASEYISKFHQSASPGASPNTLKYHLQLAWPYVYIDRDNDNYAPYYNVANLVTVTKLNIMDKIPCGYETPRSTAVRIQHPVSFGATQRFQLFSMSPTEQHRGLSCFKSWISYKSNLVAFWIHLLNSRCCQKHLTMLLQSLRGLCIAPEGPKSIWKYLEALVLLTGVSESLECGFWINLHFADEK